MGAQRRLKNVDAAERAFRVKAGFWSLGAGVGGAMIGGHFAGAFGVVLGFPLGWTLCFLITMWVVDSGGRAAEVLYYPSGKSTPFKREYSQAQALAMRGRHREAADVYEAACREFPEDPTPYLHLARLLRDHLGEYEVAARWFREARQHAMLTEPQALMIAQELVALYLEKLEAPRRALPELADLARRFPGTPTGAAAARELEELRAMLAIEQAGGASVTAQFRARRSAPQPGS